MAAMNERTQASDQPGSVQTAGYAAFIDRGRGWEQCTFEMSRDSARSYVRTRRKQEKAYPMGKRFKTDKAKRHNGQAQAQPPTATPERKGDDQ